MRSLSWIVLFWLAPALCQAGYVITTIDVPGAAGTHINDINDNGVAVGYYWTASNQYHAFKYSNGVITNIDPTGLAGNGADYGPYGITNDGRVVGFYRTAAGTHGYIQDAAGTRTFDFPGQTYGFPTRINNQGDVLGFYTTDGITGKGYLYTGGTFTQLSGGPLNTVETQAYGLNDLGVVVGQYFNAGLNRYQPFRLDSGGFSVLEPSIAGLIGSVAFDINNAGTIVGQYQLADRSIHGYIYQSGQFSAFDVPGASGTGIGTINNQGVIGGRYLDPSGVEHGFIATPTAVPEPSSVALLGAGAILLIGRRARALLA